jgi:hypothetical protein
MTWFAFHGNYAPIDLAGVQEKEATALGFHGYATEAQARANPNDVGPWQSAILDALEEDYATAVTEKAQPGGVNASNPLAAGAAGAESAIGNAIPGVTDIGDFFHRLTEGSTWVRVGEVIFGGIILWAGVKALTSQTAAGNAASSVKRTAVKPVKAVAKVAVPEARYAGRVAAKRAAPKTTARIASHRAQVRQYGGKRPYNP